MSESFAERWDRKERECFGPGMATEMIDCGSSMLPADAAPCLTFVQAKGPLPVWEAFATVAWTAEERERLVAHQVIGYDGAGNPICLERYSGAIVLLDHENRFRSRQFINSSVGQLAECLLAYMGEQNPVRFRAAVSSIDPAAIAEGTFWWHEAACLGVD